jgi:hypothetical protein
MKLIHQETHFYDGTMSLETSGVMIANSKKKFSLIVE